MPTLGADQAFARAALSVMPQAVQFAVSTIESLKWRRALRAKRRPGQDLCPLVPIGTPRPSKRELSSGCSMNSIAGCAARKLADLRLSAFIRGSILFPAPPRSAAGAT